MRGFPGDHYDDDDDGRTTTMSASDLHSLYNEQMKEIQSEREAVFGMSHDDETSSSGQENLGRAAEAYLASSAKDDDAASLLPPPPPPPPAWRVPTSSSPSSSSSPQSSADDATTDDATTDDATTDDATPMFLPPGWDAEEAYAEREALYGFTDEEREAWTTTGPSSAGGGDGDGGRTAAAFDEYFARLAGVRRAVGNPPPSHPPSSSSSSSSSSLSSSSPFSHLNPREDGAVMVDVGGKVPSPRVAIARSVVVFPPEVMSAFRLIGGGEDTREMIGPKGPIFETARIAGIMGAK